jgi:hypothetical protein
MTLGNMRASSPSPGSAVSVGAVAGPVKIKNPDAPAATKVIEG